MRAPRKLSRFGLWIIALALVAVGSLATGSLSPTLTKTGSGTVPVGERIAIGNVAQDPRAACPSLDSSITAWGASTSGQFLVPVGE